MSNEHAPKILIVGAGGIGGLTLDLIVPALEKVQQHCFITIMDGDKRFGCHPCKSDDTRP